MSEYIHVYNNTEQSFGVLTKYCLASTSARSKNPANHLTHFDPNQSQKGRAMKHNIDINRYLREPGVFMQGPKSKWEIFIQICQLIQNGEIAVEVENGEPKRVSILLGNPGPTLPQISLN